jgi:DNA repair exonuclease SbcCD nuclease subunit
MTKRKKNLLIKKVKKKQNKSMINRDNNLIGVIGDLHMRDMLAYGDYLLDRRFEEKKEVLDFIVNSFEDCSHVVLMGDNFNSKNNSSETNRDFVEFIERLSQDKKRQIYIISGNHEKKGNGKTAIDFLKEIDRENWHIYTTPSSVDISGLKIDFLPFMLKSELGVETNEEAANKMTKDLKGGDILFAHHAISGTVFRGVKVETFLEPVLSKEKLEKKYKLILAGHIHSPLDYGKTIITGSVFNQEVGETEKFIVKIKRNLEVEKIKLPGRGIHKLENPSKAQLDKLSKDSIVKVIVTDKKINIEELQQHLTRFDAHLLIEDYPSKRKKMHIEGAFDFNIESLLLLYATEKGVDYQRLLRGLELIN